MLLKTSILSIIFLTTQINQSLQHKTCKNGLACVNNKLIQIELLPDHLTYQVCGVDSTKFRDDYTHAPSFGWYKLHTQGKTWNEARKICEGEGAHLAIINSKEEEELIVELMGKGKDLIKDVNNPDFTWLGGHNLFANDDWVTIFGESLSSTGHVNWSKGCPGIPPEPNNSGGKEHCLSMAYRNCERGFNDLPCNVKSAFVCKKSNVC